MKYEPVYEPVLDLLPKSAATNAYEVFNDIIRAIQEEPSRLDQTDWAYVGWRLARRGHRFDHLPVPECNTVGCVAGWWCLLTDPSTALGEARALGEASRGSFFPDRVERDLNCYPLLVDSDARNPDVSMREDLDMLFSPSVTGDMDPDDEYENNLVPGDPEYVPMVIDRIRVFQAKWETRLKATPITIKGL